MSFFRKLVGTVAPIVGGAFGGPVGAALGGAIGGALQRPGAAALPEGMLTMGALPTLPAIGGAVVAGGAVALRSAAAVSRAAVTWCRSNPAWCSSIGGTAAVAALIREGRLPMPRRRRGRGLSSRDLRGFRKTTRLIRQVAGSVGIRRGRARSGGGAGGHTVIAAN